MSQIIFAEQASAPSTPSSGKASLYVTTAPELRIKDDAGNVITIPQVLTGVWTPALVGDSVAGAQTYTIQVGRYVKIGALVQAGFFVFLSAKGGTMAGNIIISGLPFASKNLTNYIQTGAISYFANLATSIVHIGLDLPPNTTSCRLYKTTAAATAVSNMVAADIAATTAFAGTIVYEADA